MRYILKTKKTDIDTTPYSLFKTFEVLYVLFVKLV